MIEVEIDKGSGFCFGVVTAIESAERELKNTNTLYCLGDIVHNSLEVERLEKSGLRTIGHDEFTRLKGEKVLLRAHGEPPSTYEIARRNNITIVDATCPVVLQLQRKIHKCYVATRDSHTQVVIYGKKGHAEVNGLVGQTEGTAIVIEKVQDLGRLDFSRNICLFSQTTKSLDGFREVVAEIRRRIADGVQFEYFDTICRQVANRLPNIKAFASKHDWVYFVAGKKSSNGKMLLEEETKCFAFLAGHESFAAAEGAIGIARTANKVRKEPLRVILNGLGKDAAQIISRINGFTYVKTDYDFKTGELKVVETIPYSDGERAAVKCYGANDVLEGVAIMKAEGVEVSITGNSTNPTRFQHLVAGTYKKWALENGKKYFSVASGGGTGRTLHPDNVAAGPASYGLTDSLGRVHGDAQFAGSSSVPAHVEMMGLIGMGNNPMVGATVACAVAAAQANA